VLSMTHEHDSAHAAVEALTLDQFHRHMGHISPEIAHKLVQDKFVTGVRLEHTPSRNPFFCESCVYAKATRKFVPKARQGERATEFGQETHSDLWGPAPVESKGGKHYYVTHIDDKTRLTHLNLLRKKSEAPAAYKAYEAWCETQLGARLKILNSDRGGEYQGAEFVKYLKSRGTEQKLNVHDTPQHAGVAERHNRTIAEHIHALLHASGLPKSLWGEAAHHVVWLLNRMTTKAINGMTTYEATFGKKLNLSGVREWGDKVWVRVEAGDKLGGRVKEGRWMGIDKQSKGVRVYGPDKHNVTVERNIYYDETCTSVSRFEGEDWDGFVEIETKPDSPNSKIPDTDPLKPNAPPPDNEIPPINQVPDPEPSSAAEESTSKVETQPKRIRKPTQKVRDLLEGRTTTSTRSGDPLVA